MTNQKFSSHALAHFDRLWKLFDRDWLSAGGSLFLIDPLRPCLTRSYAQTLTPESARIAFHTALQKWGELNRIEPKHGYSPGGDSANRPVHLIETWYVDSDVRWSRDFILSSFYNLCALGTYNQTIEELIYRANERIKVLGHDPDGTKAFGRLVALNKAFLLAEWAHDLIDKAICNRDMEFFQELARSITHDIPTERFDTIRRWLGVTLLWYLGGRDMRPRREFLSYLNRKGILAADMDEQSFQSMLSNLGLLRKLPLS